MWNFEDCSHDVVDNGKYEKDDNVIVTDDLQELISQVKKRRNINAPARAPKVNIDPPETSSVKLPTPQSSCVGTSTSCPSVIRGLLDSMRSDNLFKSIAGKNKANEVSSIKQEDESGTDYVSGDNVSVEKFEELDEEMTRELEHKYSSVVPESVVIDPNKDLEFVPPDSPGAGYEKEYINCEIGVRAPRFKPDVHELIYRNHMGIDDDKIKKITASARKVEQDLRKRYNRSADIGAAQINTLSKLQSRYKKRKTSKMVKWSDIE